MKFRRTAAALAVAAAASTTVVLATPAHAAGYRTPVSSFPVGDPGILWDSGQFVNFYTGWRAKVATAPYANGPWKQAGHALNADPVWSKQSTSTSHPAVWAPSAIKISSGKYMLTYAAQREDSSYLRCIGVAFATKATGPYTPASTPLSCINGRYGAPDVMSGAASNDSVIDATPRFLTFNGSRGLYVTYKTQHSVGTKGQPGFHYYSTIRMVRVQTASNASSVKIFGTSHILTTRPDNIEENPVMVQRGNTFTLFTSLGGYTLCSYHTEYRTSTHLWGWPATSHRLSFPSNTNTCGTGDADVYYSPQAKAYRIFWSGRPGGAGKSHPFYLYSGELAFSNGVPKVTGVDARKS